MTDKSDETLEQVRNKTMTESKDQDTGKGRLSLRPAGRLELGRTVDAGSVRQSFSHGRSKVVQVEVRKSRTGVAPVPAATTPAPSSGPRPAQTGAPGGGNNHSSPKPAHNNGGQNRGSGRGNPSGIGRALTAAEQATRQRVLEEQRIAAERREIERREQEKIMILSAAEEAKRREEENRRAAEEAARQAEEDERAAAIAAREQKNAPQDVATEVAALETSTQTETAAPAAVRPAAPAAVRPAAPARPATGAAPETLRLRTAGDDDDGRARRPGVPVAPRKPQLAPVKKAPGEMRRAGRIDVRAAIDGEDERTRSMSSVRRQRDRERRQAELERLRADQVKVVRDVILPEAITVSELANRMAARTAEVIKSLMRMGVMATVTQSLDADTAELVVQEFGHRARRVSESDVEIGLEGETDEDTVLIARAPVVTIMGHVDHGKTSLLDALRSTDIAGGEAGGITQHIGAYQVKLANGGKITFIDTPGHEAFTAMRSRGASVRDVVVLVVAADDGVKPQTIEAIRHAKAAGAPLIVAINKMDKPGADPSKVRQELLSYEIVVEAMSGDTMDVEVSAKARLGLDKLEEAILLQAEIMNLRANPERAAEGSVIESRLDRGRGPVATLLVQKGTLRQGDIVVAGAEWGRVRAMLDHKGRQLEEAGPSTPVEILGLSSVPSAGEPFVAVENEGRAREISEFRQRKIREKAAAGIVAGRGTMDQMLARIQAGAQKEVALLIKADMQGSAEALQATVMKLEHEEVKVRVLLAGVGQISESDVQLAKASNAVLVAFNVRATSQARDLAQRDGVDIRYYSIIYDVADDVEKLVRGKVAPKAREKFLGYAEIRKVFDITKTGKVAGCMVTEGIVKRGAGVRLLREGTVIHTGDLSQLKRFKDDVKEVARNYECGLSFAGYNDLREGDQVECFETEYVPA